MGVIFARNTRRTLSSVGRRLYTGLPRSLIVTARSQKQELQLGLADISDMTTEEIQAHDENFSGSAEPGSQGDATDDKSSPPIATESSVGGNSFMGHPPPS